MSEIDKYYQILGLNPGASEEAIKEAYRDLVKVWHPDRFSHDPQLGEKANVKLREIIIAYDKLRSYLSEETKRGSTSEGQSYAETQSAPDEPPLTAEQNKTTQTDNENHTGFQPPPGQSFDQPPVRSIDSGVWNRFGIFIVITLAIIAIIVAYLKPGAIFRKTYSASEPPFSPPQKEEQTSTQSVSIQPTPTQPPSEGAGSKSADDIFARAMAHPAEQIEWFTKAITLNPNDATNYASRGNAYSGLQDYRQAIDDFSKAISLDPKNALHYSGRAQAYSRLQNHQQAIMDLTTAIELDPEFSLGHFGAYGLRGVEYQQLGKYRQAIQDYEKHFEKPHNPGFDAEIYYFRGIAYAQLGEDTRAVADLKTAAGLGDESAKAILIKSGLSW